MAKKWNKENISELLQKSDKAVLRGLKVIYSLQTESEKEIETTHFHNGVGFTGSDAQFLTSLAKSYEHYGKLTEKQMIFLRKKIMKYAGQLARVSNGEIGVSI